MPSVLQLDLTNAYHRMRIRDEGGEWKTAFRTWYDHFKYQVMPFGLSNASASFQGYFKKNLAEKLDVVVIVYLEDILIYTEDPGQGHIEAVRWVLENFRKHGLYANLKKCGFQKDEVQILCYVVFAHERIDAVKTWNEPKSVRDIQVFINSIGVLPRASVRSQLNSPQFRRARTPASSRKVDEEAFDTGGKAIENRPNPKCVKGRKYFSEKPISLTPDARRAFTRLRQAVTKAPILRPDFPTLFMDFADPPSTSSPAILSCVLGDGFLSTEVSGAAILLKPWRKQR